MHRKSHCGSDASNQRRAAWILRKTPGKHASHGISKHIYSASIDADIFVGNFIYQVDKHLDVIIKAVSPPAPVVALPLSFARRIAKIWTALLSIARGWRLAIPSKSIGATGKRKRSRSIVIILGKTIDGHQYIPMLVGQVPPIGVEKIPPTTEGPGGPTMIYKYNLVGLVWVEIGRSVYTKGTVGFVIALECDGIVLVVTGVWDIGTSICQGC